MDKRELTIAALGDILDSAADILNGAQKTVESVGDVPGMDAILKGAEEILEKSREIQEIL